jgi:hypothetical protein
VKSLVSHKFALSFLIKIYIFLHFNEEIDKSHSEHCIPILLLYAIADADNDALASDNTRYHCFRMLLIFRAARIVRATRLRRKTSRLPRHLLRFSWHGTNRRGRIVNRKPECRNEYHQDKICATCDRGPHSDELALA